MHPFRRALIAAALPAAALPAAAPAEPSADPMRFFVGRTESEGTTKIMLRKPHRVRNHGQGRIEADGSLHLVQNVEEEGQPPKQRVWRIRQVGPGRYAGSMSEAEGPVTIEEERGRYRFRFRLKGRLSVEQWLTPLPGGAARSDLTVKKLGLTVAHGTSVIRRVGGGS